MALPLGPILLLAVVGGAVFAGLDVRKKKKNGKPVIGNDIPASGNDIVTCAHVIDFKADMKQASLDGGAWQSAEELDNQPEWAVLRQRPQVLFIVCDPDPTVIQLLEQFCTQSPAIDFYGVYVHRLPSVVRPQAVAECQQRNALVGFVVNVPTGGVGGREYNSDYIPELLLQRGGNATEVLSKVLLFAQGVDHPGAEDYELVGGGEAIWEGA